MKTKYEQLLLENWEDVFRQGLLTYWTFMALYLHHERSVSRLKIDVQELTDGSYQTSEQVLYRLLRKQYDLETVNYREVKGNGGPKQKLYKLSPLGVKLLADFHNRNITLFNTDMLFTNKHER